MKFKIFLLLVILVFGIQKQVSAAEVSLTFDDFDVSDSVIDAKERNARILKTIESHGIKGTLYMKAKNIESNQGKALLADWDRKGHEIANHTWREIRLI